MKDIFPPIIPQLKRLYDTELFEGKKTPIIVWLLELQDRVIIEKRNPRHEHATDQEWRNYYRMVHNFVEETLQKSVFEDEADMVECTIDRQRDLDIFHITLTEYGQKVATAIRTGHVWDRATQSVDVDETRQQWRKIISDFRWQLERGPAFSHRLLPKLQKIASLDGEFGDLVAEAAILRFMAS